VGGPGFLGVTLPIVLSLTELLWHGSLLPIAVPQTSIGRQRQPAKAALEAAAVFKLACLNLEAQAHFRCASVAVFDRFEG
jgi:hypothetical protein